jgi:translation initiation factor 3 subunit J
MAPPKKQQWGKKYCPTHSFALTMIADESSEEDSSDDEPVAAPKVAPARKKFDDEEDSEDTPDDWENEEDSEVEREKAKKAAEAKAIADAEAAKNKKSKAQRIEEHREANRRRRALEDDETSDEEEDEATKRAQAKLQEKDADLKHAQDLFGDVDLRNNKKAANKATVIPDPNNPGQAIDLATVSLFKPSTKGQFDTLSDALTPLIRAASSKPHFSLWIPNFTKSICQDMNSTDIKKVASALTALSNEKMKEEKAKDGSKKTKAAKQKTTLAADRGIGRNTADTTAYDEDGLDDGDFM